MASYDLLLRGNGKGDFQAVRNSGLKIFGEMRDFLVFKNKKEQLVMASINNDKICILKY